MNEEFEALPFAAGELEEEHGRMSTGGRGGRSRGGGRPVFRGGARPGRGAVARPSRPQGLLKPKPGPRLGQQRGPRPGRWPRGPYWGPAYGWPGGVMVSEPMGYPLPAQDTLASDDMAGAGAAPPIEPIDLPATDDGGGDDAAPQEEMPGALRTVIASMAAAAPAFRYAGRLDNVRNLGLPRKPGFYLITFRKGNAWKAYNGQTGNLHERLVKHRLGATVLGLPVTGHHVYIAESGRPEPARRNIEMAINRAMLRNHPGVLTNQNAELEMELLGWD